MQRTSILTLAAIVVGLFLTEHVSSHQAPQSRPRQIREPYISVVDFGAIPNDNRWDADAIQRAIDSLPKAGPDATTPSGGVVVLPAGKYMLNKPIRIFNGITLRGEGSATILHVNGDHPAILLTSPFPHHFVVTAGVEDLSIYTAKSAGIAPAPDVTNIIQTRFVNLIISAGACALDLNPGLANKTWMQNTLIRNVQVFRYGGPALTLWGNHNHIEQIDVEGGTRAGFKADPAIITIDGGGNDIRSCHVGANQPDKTAIAFHLSGSFTWAHNWIELHPRETGYAYIFKDVEVGQIDYLHQIVPSHKAKFVNCASILIRSLNLDGELGSLDHFLELDENSNVRIDSIVTRMDAGMVDDPRISVGTVWNKAGKHRTDFPLRGEPVRLLSDGAGRPTGNWHAHWDTPQGQIQGSMQLETGEGEPAGNRMRVRITENATTRQLRVEVPLPDDPRLIGRKPIVTWRIDGPPQTLVTHNDKQIPSRAMNSLTANPLPQPLAKGDRLIFIFPPEPGEYFISEVALYPP